MTENTYAKVADVMTRPVRSIGRMATVKEAIDIMREANVSSLIVERRDDSDEFGLLVISDIAREVVAKERSAERVNVYEVMSKPAVTLPAEMNIKYGVRLLVKFSLSRALVVDKARAPLGIATLRDMILRSVETDYSEPENDGNA